MLFWNMLDRGIFLKHPERLAYKSLSGYMSELLSMQDNLLKATAAELLRTDEHTVYLPDTHVLVHYRTGSPPTRLHTYWRGPMKVLEGRDSRYKRSNRGFCHRPPYIENIRKMSTKNL